MVECHTLHGSLGGIFPLVLGVNWHQYRVAFRHGVLLSIADNRCLPFQHINDMLPRVVMAAGMFGFAGTHSGVPGQYKVRDTIRASQNVFCLQVPVVVNNRRLACAFRSRLGSRAALLRAEGLRDHAPQGVTAVINRLVGHVLRYEDRVAFFYRVFLTVAGQGTGALEDVYFMLPGMHMTVAALAGLDLVFAQDAGCYLVFCVYKGDGSILAG